MPAIRSAAKGFAADAGIPHSSLAGRRNVRTNSFSDYPRGFVNLPLLEKWSAARRRNAAYYNAPFQDSRVGTPFIRPDCISIYNQYVIRVQEQDGLAAHLKEHRIGTEIYYPRPCTSRNALRI